MYVNFPGIVVNGCDVARGIENHLKQPKKSVDAEIAAGVTAVVREDMMTEREEMTDEETGSQLKQEQDLFSV